MTVPAERARTVRTAQAPPPKPKAPVTGPGVAGHGLLSRFHAGCRCG
jgi:hypothetical protein